MIVTNESQRGMKVRKSQSARRHSAFACCIQGLIYFVYLQTDITHSGVNYLNLNCQFTIAHSVCTYLHRIGLILMCQGKVLSYLLLVLLYSSPSLLSLVVLLLPLSCPVLLCHAVEISHFLQSLAYCLYNNLLFIIIYLLCCVHMNQGQFQESMRMIYDFTISLVMNVNIISSTFFF